MGSMTENGLKTVEFTVSMDEINQYAVITDDFNPIHLDSVFAEATPMGSLIAHGTMSLALIWQMLRLNFGSEVLETAKLSIRFTFPVRIGDQLYAGGEKAEDGSIKVWVRNQDDKDVIAGTATL